jgi:hypothetical protein
LGSDGDAGSARCDDGAEGIEHDKFVLDERHAGKRPRLDLPA